MHYGLNLPNGGVNPQTLGEFAALAEEAGWDGVFLEDYIVWQGHRDTPTYDPWVILAAMALRTEHVRLGTMVTPLARRRPWKVAREAVTLDHLSNGRLILGIGLGDNISGDVSFTHFGETADPRQRAKMLDEALDVLVGLWDGEPYSFHGEYYHVDEVTLLPRPVQFPRIPIWVGGAYPLKGPMQRATRWDGACMYKNVVHYMQPDDVRALKTFVEGHRLSPGPFDIVVGGSPRRDDWEEERAYIRSLAEAGITWWVEYVPPDDLDLMRACIKRGPLRVA
jgi:alkanesulfonate monooxygenase SsuD/methylene tetrahydromethanopterin reductase-like flavin-dependent oxidoreductase (luciferase family)